MRAPNFYSHPGFERAGLRRRDAAWIREGCSAPGSFFVPVWRNQSLVTERHGGARRPVVLAGLNIAGILETGPNERLDSGELVFLGLIGEQAHFALDLSTVEAPLDMLRSPVLAAGGSEAAAMRFADLRHVAAQLARPEGALLSLAPAAMCW